jgi:hypothetical protein
LDSLSTVAVHDASMIKQVNKTHKFSLDFKFSFILIRFYNIKRCCKPSDPGSYTIIGNKY